GNSPSHDCDQEHNHGLGCSLHYVAKVCALFQILTCPSIPPRQQSPVPSDPDSGQLWACGSCLDLCNCFHFL
ncbi:hypothetical protein PENNAL_c0802G08554, partial [Penicillium nalgiovense]